MSLRRPPSEAAGGPSKQNLTGGDARWKIPECWRDESHESHRKKCQLNSTACPTRSNASVSEGWEQRGSKCPIRLPHAQVDSARRPYGPSAGMRPLAGGGAPPPRSSPRSAQSRRVATPRCAASAAMYPADLRACSRRTAARPGAPSTASAVVHYGGGGGGASKVAGPAALPGSFVVLLLLLLLLPLLGEGDAGAADRRLFGGHRSK